VTAANDPLVLLNAARPWGEAGPVEVARVASKAGLDGVGLADSPLLFADPLMSTDRVLAETDLSVAGPCVLSLGLREPSSVAGALRTLADRHAGRVVCFVGRGESSVRNAGLPVPSLRDHLASVQRLVELTTDVAVPVVGAASGPRTIARTSEALPAVMLDVGVDPRTVAHAAAIARQARPDVDIWLFVRAAITGDDAQAAAAAAPVLGSCAARLAAAPEFYGLSEEQHALAVRVAAAHDYRRHGTREASSVELSSAEEAEVRSRFLASGTANEVAAAFAALAPVGVAGVVLAGAVSGVMDGLPDLAGAVRAGLTAANRDRLASPVSDGVAPNSGSVV